MGSGNPLIKKANPVSVPACAARPVHGGEVAGTGEA